MTTPLENLAMIGDGETVALVSSGGTIEWLCLPRFDSPACCAALLGNRDHGHWTIEPRGKVIKAEQRYRSDTLVLETELSTHDGTIRITDFMPIRNRNPTLVRIVEGVSGKVTADLTTAFRFDYGNMPPWTTREDNFLVFHVGPDKLVLCGIDDPRTDDGTVTATLELEKSTRHVFTLAYGAAHEEVPAVPDADEALKQTEKYWRGWLGGFDRPVPYEREVRRSLLVLKALIHRPTGGLVAAATTSLPELSGGDMNWDYRYCWLRDAAFTVRSLVECGYMEEANAWRDWMLRAVAGSVEKLKIMYRVDGSRRLDETTLDWLPGYRFARPVRIGNTAAAQFQLDVFGEVINMLHECEVAGMERTEQTKLIEHEIIGLLETAWERPDHGLWEDRGEPRHYVTSKVMAWVAFDRFLRRRGELPRARRNRLIELRDHIHDTVCSDGFNNGLGSFTSYFGGQTFDASLLLLPKVGFLPMSDERMAGTVALIEKHLVADGLVHRYQSHDIAREGAFLACSFWLAECQLLDRRRDDAVRTIERALAVGGELGLLSEQYDTVGGDLAGNYPQALSHLGLVSAVLSLAAYDEE